MPLFAEPRRLLVPEKMDDPDLPRRAHVAALTGLDRINWITAAAAVFWPAIRELSEHIERPVRVLDVATGDGGTLRSLSRRARKNGVRVELAGCDLSRQALAIARIRARRAAVPARFFHADVLREPLPRGYDVVMCSLFLHHLTPAEAVVALRNMSESAAGMLLVSDLRRSRWGLLLAQIGTRLLTRSTIVHYDGPQSVRAAFTAAELAELAAEAGLRGAAVARKFPARLLLRWQRPAG